MEWIELPKVDGHSPFSSSVVRDRVKWQKASLKDQLVAVSMSLYALGCLINAITPGPTPILEIWRLLCLVDVVTPRTHHYTDRSAPCAIAACSPHTAGMVPRILQRCMNVNKRYERVMNKISKLFKRKLIEDIN